MKIQIGPCNRSHWIDNGTFTLQQSFNLKVEFCNGAGKVTDYARGWEVNRCSGCGLGPVDYTALRCPHCGKQKPEYGSLLAREYPDKVCPSCGGTGKTMCISTWKEGFFSFTSGWVLTFVPATESNKQQYQNVQQAQKPQVSRYSYHTGDNNQVKLTVEEIIARIKKNPQGKHRVYANGAWGDAKDFQVFAEHIPKKTSKPVAKKTTSNPKQTVKPQPKKPAPQKSVPKKSKPVEKKAVPKPQSPPKPTSKLVKPNEDSQLEQLYLAFKIIHQTFINGGAVRTLRIRNELSELLRYWEWEGINVMASYQPRMDSIIRSLYILPDEILVEIVDELETIEKLKHLAVNQPYSKGSKGQKTTSKSSSSSQNSSKNSKGGLSPRVLHNEIMDGNNGWLMEFPTSLLKTAKGKWNESRAGVIAKILREEDSRISYSLFLDWCSKYGKGKYMMLPLLTKRKTFRDLLNAFKKSGQFADKELHARVYQKGFSEKEWIRPE